MANEMRLMLSSCHGIHLMSTFDIRNHFWCFVRVREGCWIGLSGFGNLIIEGDVRVGVVVCGDYVVSRRVLFVVFLFLVASMSYSCLTSGNVAVRLIA